MKRNQGEKERSSYYSIQSRKEHENERGNGSRGGGGDGSRFSNT